MTTPQLEECRAPGWWELYRIICHGCGWESAALDPIADQADWRRAKAHRCSDAGGE